MPQKKFYAVSAGRKLGIYSSWDECQKQVNGFKHAKFKGFKTLREAQQFMGISESATDDDDDTQKNAPVVAKRAIESSDEARAKKRPRVEKRARSKDDVSSIWSVLVAFDGGSRGNPGIAGSGAEVLIVEKNQNNVQQARRKIHLRKYVGSGATCNMAEWQGVLCAIQQVLEQVGIFQERNGNAKPKIDLVIQGDSQLVIRQLKGEYRCKNVGLKKLKTEFDSTLEKLRSIAESLKISYQHVYRCDNTVADRLANEAMDAKKSWKTVTEVFINENGDSETNVYADL